MILSGRGVASICYNWQLLITWCNGCLKEQKFMQHHSNREITLRVRTHESLVRKHVQGECKVSFAFITEHKFSVTWLPTNRWYHAILGIKTAKLYFYFTHACHDILSSHRDFQDCVVVNIAETVKTHITSHILFYFLMFAGVLCYSQSAVLL